MMRELLCVPSPEPTTSALADAIEQTVRYLASDAARRSLDADTYWPKWDSPWWHMLLLHELGEARRIPEPIVRHMVDGLNALPLHVFPIRPEDSPPGTDPQRDSSCHCALGAIHQVLSACGIVVAHELPWIEAWFPRYQMADGGLNCDADAYLVADECASSMVGTIAPLEAMIGRPEARTFVDRAARFLVERRLVLGSPTAYNAAEREAQVAWLDPCFPRFYFYDVLRGLAALARWAETTPAATLPHAVVAPVVEHLSAKFPDGIVRVARRAHAVGTTLTRTPDGAWLRQRDPASTFPLLDATSVLGEPSPALSRQWTVTRRSLLGLLDAGRIDR